MFLCLCMKQTTQKKQNEIEIGVQYQAPTSDDDTGPNQDHLPVQFKLQTGIFVHCISYTHD